MLRCCPANSHCAEWYWHAVTEGQKPGANPVDAGSWDYHERMYGADSLDTIASLSTIRLAAGKKAQRIPHGVTVRIG